MGAYKTAAPCEVCGTRVAHLGSTAGFIVGHTPKGVVRIVHNSCRTAWNSRRATIVSGWIELRSDVFPTLSKRLQHRIKCRLQEQGLNPDDYITARV